MGEYNTFQKRIAGKPIRPMQARARDFANRIETAKAGCSVHVSQDSATLIMCRWHNRDRLSSDVDPKTQTRLIDIGEAFADEIGGLVTDIKENAIPTGPLHLGINHPCHDPPPREFTLS